MRQYLIAAAATAALALVGCETTPELDSGYHDFQNSDASRDGSIPGSAGDFKKNVQDHVFFDLNRHHLSNDGQAAVAQQADWLKKWPSTSVVVEGHCDERGTVEYNLALGERRANTVARALKGHGIEASRIEVVSYGKEHPEKVGSDEISWAANRRGVTVVR